MTGPQTAGLKWKDLEMPDFDQELLAAIRALGTEQAPPPEGEAVAEPSAQDEQADTDALLAAIDRGAIINE